MINGLTVKFNINLVGIKIEAWREVADGGTSSDK